MKHCLIAFPLLFSALLSGCAINHKVTPRKNYGAVGIGSQTGGAILDYRYERYLADWFVTGLNIGTTFGIDHDSTSKDQYNTEYKDHFSGYILPRIGAMGYLVVPRGFFRGFRFGLGVEGFFYNIDMESRGGGSTFKGTAKGFNYSYNADLLSVGIAQADKGQKRVWTIGLTLGTRFGGPEKELVQKSGTSTLTEFVNPNRGLYIQLMTGYRFK